jgi:hypothetical protein
VSVVEYTDDGDDRAVEAAWNALGSSQRRLTRFMVYHV